MPASAASVLLEFAPSAGGLAGWSAARRGGGGRAWACGRAAEAGTAAGNLTLAALQAVALVRGDRSTAGGAPRGTPAGPVDEGDPGMDWVDTVLIAFRSDGHYEAGVPQGGCRCSSEQGDKWGRPGVTIL